MGIEIIGVTRSRKKRIDSTGCPAKCHWRSGGGDIGATSFSNRLSAARESRGDNVSDRNLVMSRTAATPDKPGRVPIGNHSSTFRRPFRVAVKFDATTAAYRTFAFLSDFATGKEKVAGRLSHRRKYKHTDTYRSAS